jgi:hypothetical protein
VVKFETVKTNLNEISLRMAQKVGFRIIEGFNFHYFRIRRATSVLNQFLLTEFPKMEESKSRWTNGVNSESWAFAAPDWMKRAQDREQWKE